MAVGAIDDLDVGADEREREGVEGLLSGRRPCLELEVGDVAEIITVDRDQRQIMNKRGSRDQPIEYPSTDEPQVAHELTVSFCYGVVEVVYRIGPTQARDPGPSVFGKDCLCR